MLDSPVHLQLQVLLGGASLNGNDYWVTDEGVTLGQYLEKVAHSED